MNLSMCFSQVATQVAKPVNLFLPDLAGLPLRCAAGLFPLFSLVCVEFWLRWLLPWLLLSPCALGTPDFQMLDLTVSSGFKFSAPKISLLATTSVVSRAFEYSLRF